MYGSMEESTPAAAPALGPAELKAVRKLLATNGDDARSTGLSHESQVSLDIKYLRKYGCRYLRDPSLWDSLDSYEAWTVDARSNNSTVKSPYWLGRNLCVRGRGHKQKEEKPATALLPMKGGVVAAPRTRSMRRVPSRRS